MRARLVVLICRARHGVSTGSGSDRVPGDNKLELATSLPRSLPLPVLTSYIKLGNCRTATAVARDVKA